MSRKGGTVTARVFGIHLPRLREGVDDDESAIFVAEWLSDPGIRRFADVAGWKPYVVKGDGGDRAGGYCEWCAPEHHYSI